MSQLLECYQVIGLMSGTSLDGLDIAHCRFEKDSGKWQFSIVAAETVTYPDSLLRRLKSCTALSGLELALLNVDLGIFMGDKVADFASRHSVSPDFVSSHGHTVFHQPDKQLTVQIGSAAHLSARCGWPVVADFRTLDVALGGNGAPLVPVGDELLFSAYDVCLNLGGIANLSYSENKQRRAFDVCPFNLVFNALAQELGFDYDDHGKLTSQGKIIPELLNEWNDLDYYRREGPKSLGWEQVSAEFIEPMKKYDNSAVDKLNTFCRHAVQHISSVIPDEAFRVLVTGGGAYHRYFIEQFRKVMPEVEIHVPEASLVNFKEALIFAFLGVLRWRGEANCLASVTGAGRDSVGGIVFSG